MELTQQEREEIAKVLEEKWKNTFCLKCEHRDILIDGTVYELREYNHGNISTNSKIAAMVPVACENCGHVEFVNYYKLKELISE